MSAIFGFFYRFSLTMIGDVKWKIDDETLLKVKIIPKQTELRMILEDIDTEKNEVHDRQFDTMIGKK